MRTGHYRRRARTRNRADRKARGISDRRRRAIWRVEPELIPIPEWARRRAVWGLTAGPEYIWLGRGDARLLEQLDREAGGVPMVVETEFRYCKACGRPLIGEDAAARRMAEMGGRTAYMLPCGDECVEASKDGRWKGRRG